MARRHGANQRAGFRLVEPAFLLTAMASMAMLAELGSEPVQFTRRLGRQLLAIEPGLTIRSWRASVALTNEAIFSTYEDALRKAGLPE